MTILAPGLSGYVRFDTPHGTMRIEIPIDTDYLIVMASLDPHPEDWQAILGLVSRLCPASPHALTEAGYDHRHDIWIAVYDPACLRAELGWL